MTIKNRYHLGIKGWVILNKWTKQDVSHFNIWQKKKEKKERNFKPKLIRRGHYILITGEIQEDIIILNIYALNRLAPRFIKDTLPGLKSHVSPHTVMVSELNPELSPTDRWSTQN